MRPPPEPPSATPESLPESPTADAPQPQTAPPPDFQALLEASMQREKKAALELRGCLSRGGIFFLVSAALLHLIVLVSSPHWVFEADEPFWLESLDQLAFQAMLWGFANVLWRPQSCRPWLLLAKAGFCFQMALGTGGQSFDAILPRSAAILFMWIAMWHLLSRLGIGALEGSSDALEPPP